MRRLHKLQLSNISIGIESMLRILFGVLIDIHDIIISQDLRQCSNSSNTVTNGDKVLRKNGICFFNLFCATSNIFGDSIFHEKSFQKMGHFGFFETNNEFFLIKNRF